VTTIVGGLRTRFIKDSFFDYMEDKLTLLGWFNPNREHIPISLFEEALPNDEEIPFNSLTVEWATYTYEDIEVGSRLGEHTHTVYVDFYAENDALGMHLINDVAAIFDGRLTAIGATSPTFPVLNQEQATPTEIFRCEITDVRIDKARDFPAKWQKFWWSCRLGVLDTFSTDAV
jgi:hypothetical protein